MFLTFEAPRLTRLSYAGSLPADMALSGASTNRSREQLVRASVAALTLVAFVVALAVQGRAYLWCDAMQRPMASSCCPAAARSDADTQNVRGASLGTRCCEQRLRATLGAACGNDETAPMLRAPLVAALRALSEIDLVAPFLALGVRWLPRGGLSPPALSKRLALLSILRP